VLDHRIHRYAGRASLSGDGSGSGQKVFTLKMS
jgi:hypothetical protein